MLNPPEVTIIILNWNGWHDTVECLESLIKISYSNYKVKLIDNGSTDDSVKRIKDWTTGKTALEKKIEIITLTENLGFAAGNNQAIAKALEQRADYILLLNNDTVVESDFLGPLVETAVKEEAGVASPKIMFDADPSKIWFAGGDYMPILKKPFHRFYGQKDSGQVGGTVAVKWVSGCCMLIKREVIDRIGMLDPDYFNNYEDVDFCVRAGREGYKIIIVPKSKIYHKFAASLGGKFSPLYTYYRTRNNLLFFKKTKQTFPLALNLLTFPLYSIIESVRKANYQSMLATMVAVYDFVRGKTGK
jgi:hypothetical protein